MNCTCTALSRHAFIAAGVVVAAGLSAAAASAQVTVYNSAASFASAITGSTVVGFTAPPGLDYFYGFDTTHVFDGITVDTTASGAGIYTLSPDYNGAYDYGTGRPVLSIQSGTTSNDVTFALPAGTTVFGLDFGEVNSEQFEFDVTLADSVVPPPTFATDGTPLESGGSGFAFVGFTSPSSDIVSVTAVVPTADEIPSYDELTYGTALSAAELGTAPLLAVAAASLAVVWAGLRLRPRCVTVPVFYTPAAHAGP